MGKIFYITVEYEFSDSFYEDYEIEADTEEEARDIALSKPYLPYIDPTGMDKSIVVIEWEDDGADDDNED